MNTPRETSDPIYPGTSKRLSRRLMERSPRGHRMAMVAIPSMLTLAELDSLNAAHRSDRVPYAACWHE